MILRKATIADLELLINLRLDFLNDGNDHITTEETTAIRFQLDTYYRKYLPDSFIAVLAEIDDKVVATAFLAISEKPANLNFITGKTGTLLNVFTYPSYRGRGVATQVIREIIAEAKKLGVSAIELLATPAGKPLYQKFGFSEPKHTAMRLKLV